MPVSLSQKKKYFSRCTQVSISLFHLQQKLKESGGDGRSLINWQQGPSVLLPSLLWQTAGPPLDLAALGATRGRAALTQQPLRDRDSGQSEQSGWPDINTGAPISPPASCSGHRRLLSPQPKNFFLMKKKKKKEKKKLPSQDLAISVGAKWSPCDCSAGA